jgi:hypothetical protein
MIINNIKRLVQYRADGSIHLQRSIHNGRQLEDGRTLSDYNIRPGSTLFLIERLRGGMYHFTSGRQDFTYLTYESAEAVKNVLKFKIKSKTHTRRYSSNKLQEYILQAQHVLSILYRNIQNIYVEHDLTDLKKVILPTIDDDDEDSSDSENEDMSSEE